ncbi:hypothetical protein EVJ58_g8269 [Rhodofomes roseus]|uniref:Uncharacterized protein n=1 Tax=Rhodofomes roseus TaxID=34475 RepID=A0A4Y9Y0G0_9APHY|nr:hypothetical protein EVJ58_g8269 [Rhodofomes roseus]
MNAGGGSSKGKKGRGARTRADVMKDMSTWAQEHNGDTLTIACWQAMDLVKDIRKADTHFLGVTLRKNEDWTNVRAMYKLVDAQVLPLTLVAQKYATVADAYDEHPVDVIDQVLGADKRRRLADGGLGSVLVIAFELSPDENMTVEEAVLKKNTPTLQPLGLFQVHKDSFSRRPQMFASFWKQSLKNALDGGAWDPVFRPWPAAQS